MANEIAKLVYVSLATRVVIDKTATTQQILDAARANFREKIDTELGEHLESIAVDTECPYCWPCESDTEMDENGDCTICGTHIYHEDDLRICPVCKEEVIPTEAGKCPECKSKTDCIENVTYSMSKTGRWSVIEEGVLICGGYNTINESKKAYQRYKCSKAIADELTKAGMNFPLFASYELLERLHVLYQTAISFSATYCREQRTISIRSLNDTKIVSVHRLHPLADEKDTWFSVVLNNFVYDLNLWEDDDELFLAAYLTTKDEAGHYFTEDYFYRIILNVI